jgi:hypothetical protein
MTGSIIFDSIFLAGIYLWQQGNYMFGLTLLTLAGIILILSIFLL